MDPRRRKKDNKRLQTRPPGGLDPKERLAEKEGSPRSNRTCWKGAWAAAAALVVLVAVTGMRGWDWWHRWIVAKQPTLVSLVEDGTVPMHGAFRPSALASMRARTKTSPIAAFAWHRGGGGDLRTAFDLAHDAKFEKGDQMFSDGSGYHMHEAQGARVDALVEGTNVSGRVWTMRLQMLEPQVESPEGTGEGKSPTMENKHSRVVFYITDEAGGEVFPVRADEHDNRKFVEENLRHLDDELPDGVLGDVSIYGKTADRKPWLLQTSTSSMSLYPQFWATCSGASYNATQVIARRLWMVAAERGDGRFEVRLPNRTSCSRPNFVALEWIALPPFNITVSMFQTAGGARHTGNSSIRSKSFEDQKYAGMAATDTSDPCAAMEDPFEAQVCIRQRAFKTRFRRLFQLHEKPGIGEVAEQVARKALSQLLAGMGYFYGHSLISRSRQVPGTQQGPESELFTAVPARGTFPRGFLWDEGFHQLLIARWSGPTSRLILAHWLDLMDANGWIPREQILGTEARLRVPPEFVVQYSTDANPPALLLAVEEVLDRMDAGGLGQSETNAWKSFFSAAWPKLVLWVNWYKTSQAGTLPMSFQWKGRDPKTNRELNPKTLMSGLDDYPRASHPDDNERHLDLFCWMALAYRVMARLAKTCNVPENDRILFEKLRDAMSDLSLLQELHFDKQLETFSDYGKHTESLIQREIKTFGGDGAVETIRIRETDVSDPPSYRFVPHYGYVNLFPIMFKLLDANSEVMRKQLEMLRSEDHLWTPFGLRSLSKSSSLYQKHNTMHDPPYWRGAIWMNINYLVVKALEHYARIPGPNQKLIAQTHYELKMALVNNVVDQYTKDGFFYEQYNDETGRGQGAHPFTGWTTLIVLIMESTV